MQILIHIHLPVTGRRHLPNIHPRSTQAQVNLPAVSDQLRAFKLAPGNLLTLFTPSVPLATDVLWVAHPSSVRVHLSLGQVVYVVLLFPRVSDVLSPLCRSLCLTQLQREI